MKIKTYVINVILSTVSIISYGQTERIYETIYCENQSIIKGTILSEDDNCITLKLYNINDTLVLDRKLINRVINHIDYKLYSGGTYYKKNGFGNSISFHAGEDYDLKTLTQLQFLRYKIINQKFRLGAGIGWSRVTDRQRDEFGQLFMYGKYFLNNAKRRFFVDTKLGAEIKLTNAIQQDEYKPHSSGAQLQTGIGMENARTRIQRLSFHGCVIYKYSNRFIIGYMAGVSFNF